MGKYDNTAKELLELVGGKDNVLAVSHCATRLRLVINDKNKIDQKAIEKVDGVQGVFFTQGQLQVIFGLSVPDYYQSFTDVSGKKGVDVTKMQEMNKGNWFSKMLKVFPSVIMPIIPAMVGCALLKLIISLISVIVSQGFNFDLSGYPWFKLFTRIGDLAISSIVVLVAISAAQFWKCSIFNAACIAMFLVAGESIGVLIPEWSEYNILYSNIPLPDGTTFVQNFGLPYQSSLFTILLAVKTAQIIERFLGKRVSDNWKIFVIPLSTIVGTILMIIVLFGPLMILIERALNWMINNGITNPNLYGFGIAFLSFISAPLILTGMHQALIPIALTSFLTNGHLEIAIPNIASNIAQAAGALAIATMVKDDEKTKSLSLSTGLLALLGGISEPAMFGVNLRNKKVFWCTLLGAFVGGWFMGFMGSTVTNFGGPVSILSPIFGIPNTQDPRQANISMMNVAWIAIGVVISFAVTYGTSILALLSSRKTNKEVSKMGLKWANFRNKVSIIRSNVYNSKPFVWYRDTKQQVYFFVNRKAKFIHDYPNLPKNYDIKNFAKGEYVRLDKVDDKTFASGAMGPGFAINPKDGVIKSPVNGEVVMIFDTKHAIAIKSNDGIEILIHIGFDTVKLNGKGFKVFVEVGQKVKCGQTLVKFKKKELIKKGYTLTTPLVITNSHDFKEAKFTKLDNNTFESYDVEILKMINKKPIQEQGSK